MADITPETAASIGYNSNRQFLIGDPTGDTPFNAGFQGRLTHGMRHLTYYFADADTTELFIPPKGTIACAFQANTLDDLITASVGSTGIIFTGDTNSKGWLHVLCRGTNSTGSTTTEAPVAKGTAGYVEPRRGMYLNDKNATPDTLTGAATEHRIVNKLGLKLRIFPIAATANASDRWKSQSSGLCPGIVAVAWQPGIAAEDVNVTLDAAGDVIFTNTVVGGPTELGFLWAWSR